MLGATVSGWLTSNECVALAELPAWSVAVASKVWEPRPRSAMSRASPLAKGVPSMSISSRATPLSPSVASTLTAPT